MSFAGTTAPHPRSATTSPVQSKSGDPMVSFHGADGLVPRRVEANERPIADVRDVADVERRVEGDVVLLRGRHAVERGDRRELPPDLERLVGDAQRGRRRFGGELQDRDASLLVVGDGLGGDLLAAREANAHAPSDARAVRDRDDVVLVGVDDAGDGLDVLERQTDRLDADDGVARRLVDVLLPGFGARLLSLRERDAREEEGKSGDCEKRPATWGVHGAEPWCTDEANP
jgi:hypothetical protein